MLKNIPKAISPDLLKFLAEMGHGDMISIVDCNYPARSMVNRVIDVSSEDILGILKDILEVFPIDQFSHNPIYIMVENVKKETDFSKKFFKNFKHLKKLTKKLERKNFYEISSNSYVIIKTADESLYGCLALTKGVISKFLK